MTALSQYLCMPRQGHLEAAIKVFGYLQANPTGQIVVDIDDAPIHKVAKYSGEQSWSEFYTDTEEDIPYDMPEPHGYLAKLIAYVDSDHA